MSQFVELLRLVLRKRKEEVEKGHKSDLSTVIMHKILFSVVRLSFMWMNDQNEFILFPSSLENFSHNEC